MSPSRETPAPPYGRRMTSPGGPGPAGPGGGDRGVAGAPTARARAHARRPALRWSAAAWVAGGGVLGVACREGLSRAVPDVDGVPVAVSLVNVLGAFLLGWLYEALSRGAAGPDPARATRLRLLVGTGFCGGLTTYSSLATDTAVLLDRSRADLGAGYVLATVVLGAAATFAGIAAGSRVRGRTGAAS